MRILLAVHGFFPRHTGGTEAYVAKLADELRLRGHEVAVLAGSASERPTPLWERGEFQGIPVFTIHRSGLYVESWYRSFAPEVELMVGEILAAWKPEIVHVHHWRRLTRNLVEKIAARGIPVVCTLHDVSTTCPKIFRIREGSLCGLNPTGENCVDCVDRFAFQSDEEIREAVDLYREDFATELTLASAVIVPSAALRDAVKPHLGSIADRLEIVPHGSLTEPKGTSAASAHKSAGRTERGARQNRQSGAGPLRLAYWGSLSEMKGVHLLVEALREVRERAALALDLWGDFDPAGSAWEESLRAAAKGLPIRFRGGFRPEDIDGSAYDLAVFPSICLESWSFTVDEAWARGLPVLVPDRGAPSERLEGAGRTFEAESVDDLKRVLLEILARPTALSALRAKIREPEVFWRHAEKIVAIYRRAMESPQAAVADDAGREARRALDLAQRLERRDREVYWLRGRVEQQSEAAKRLESEVALREQSIKSQESVLADFNRSLLDLAASVRARDAEASGLRAQLADAKGSSAARDRDLESFAASNREYRRILSEKDAEIVARDAELERLLAETRAFAERVAQLGVEVDAARNECAALVNARDAAEAAYRAERAQKDERLGEAASALLASETSLRGVRDEASRLAAELERQRAELAAARAEAEARERDLAVGRERASSAELALGQARTELAEARQAVESVRAECLLLSADRDRIERLAQNLAAAFGDRDAEAADLEDALGIALAESSAIQGAASAAARLDAEVRRRLAPIAEEALGAALDDAPIREIVDGVARNHDRLHRLIRERDELLHHFIAQLDKKHVDERPAPFDVETRIATWRASKPQRERKAPGERLRILTVIHDFLPKHAAGTEIYAYHLAKRLATRHDVHLLFCEARHDRPRYEVSHGAYDGLPFTEVVHNYHWENFEETYRDPNMDAIFARVLEDFSPDVVHIQHLHYFSIDFIRLAKAFGASVVYTLHEFMLMCARGGQLLREDMEICRLPVPEKCADCIRHRRLGEDYGQGKSSSVLGRLAQYVPQGLRDAFEHFTPPAVPKILDAKWRGIYAAAAARRLECLKSRMAEVDLFISPSAFLRDRFIESGMIAPDRIVHSDNGFFVEPFRGTAHRPSEILRFGFVGTIAEYKGVHVLVEAFEEIREPGVELEIWGDVEVFQEYKARLLGLVRNPAIKLKGRFENSKIAEVLAGLDVLVVPSLWYENSPLTIHEAWLAGLPVIASNIGGMAELVVHGVNGLHFKVGDAADLRAKIRELIADRSLVARLGRSPGPVKTIDENALEIEGIYRDVLTGAPVR